MSRVNFLAWAFDERGNPMKDVATTPLAEPLPLGTAMLSNIALSLLMWNITLRIAGLLLA